MPLTNNQVVSISLLLVFSGYLFFNPTVVIAADEPFYFAQNFNFENPLESIRNITDRLPGLNTIGQDDSNDHIEGSTSLPDNLNFSFFSREDLGTESIVSFFKEAIVLAANLFLIVINVTAQVLGVLLETLAD